MSTGALHRVVRGRMVLLADGIELPPEGTPVMVTPITVPPQRNAAILAAVLAGPQLTSAEAAELEHAIAGGRRPLAPLAPLVSDDDDTGE